MTNPRAAGAETAERHPCGATSCGTDIAADTFMCEQHTSLLAPPLRQAVRDSYEPGQSPSANRYLTAAIDAVAHREKRNKAALTPRRPVQLELFTV